MKLIKFSGTGEQTDHSITASWPNRVLFNKKKRTCHMDFTVLFEICLIWIYIGFGLVWFGSISTIVSYLMSNPFLYI